ncbi:MAG TPA: hypothetical protein VHA35_17550 [Dongiaceae bacterium]|jgi:hypothetical protein|nr:hypothetical protein [Dongiaceae bacterium]
MKIRTVLLGIVGTALLSTAALAATDTNHPANRMQMADRCATLESQYQSVITGHLGAANYDRIQGLGSQGTTECQSNQGTMGAQKLERAIADLGVKPVD